MKLLIEIYKYYYNRFLAMVCLYMVKTCDPFSATSPNSFCILRQSKSNLFTVYLFHTATLYNHNHSPFNSKRTAVAVETAELQ